MKLKHIKAIHAMKEQELLDFARDAMQGMGYSVASSLDYLFAPGTTPILLVAHVDTVHFHPPQQMFYDPQAQVLWSPQGLGADDRAGVAMIFELVSRGHRPSVLLLTGEEMGLVGARAATRDFPGLSGVNVMIELDRAHAKDAVFYDCITPALISWTKRFGWREEFGSFSDISELAPAWGIAAVNLSVGYYNQHTKTEYLNLREWRRSCDRVEKMLLSPPKELIPYTEAPRTSRVISLKGWDSWNRGKNSIVRWPEDDDKSDWSWGRDGSRTAPSSRGARDEDEDEDDGLCDAYAGTGTCDFCRAHTDLYLYKNYALLCAECFALEKGDDPYAKKGKKEEIANA